MSSDSSKKDSSNAPLWRAFRYMAPYRAMIIISISCAFFVGFATLGGIGAMLPILRILIRGQTVQDWVKLEIIAPRMAEHPGATLPWYLQLLQDTAARLPTHTVKTVAILLSGLMVMTLISNVVRFFQEYLAERTVISAVNDIRRHLYDHILHIPLGFFGLKGTSDVTSRLVQDTQGLHEGLRILLGQSIQEPIKASVAFSLALFINWKLTLLIIIFAPIMGLVIKKLGKKMRRASRAAMQNSSSMLGQIEATLTGIRVLKSARSERFERRRYTGIMAGLRREQLKMARYEALATPSVETIALIVICIIVLAAVYLVTITKTLSAENFFVLGICLAIMGESFRRLSKLNNVLQRCTAASTRIFEIMDVPSERGLAGNDGARRIKLPAIQREIRFEQIGFTYPGGASEALCDVSLVVPKGRCVAVVGRNGSGKTTLLALLPRFYQPQAGRILIDGVDIQSVTLRSLRQQISIVTQETVIFPGTIAQNIAYGLPRATREEIESAARRAFAHDFIMEKPLGYDTSLDGLGAQLSGGQKQRLCIARAILRQAPILILDEATSQVDAESEHLIQQAIESLMHQRTTFVIAHRFSTILSADEIVVMDKGQIVGRGQHESLLKECPTYQQLYERQISA